MAAQTSLLALTDDDTLCGAFAEIVTTAAKAAKRDRGIETHGVDGACGCCGRKLTAKNVEILGYKIGATCAKKIEKILAEWA